MIHIESLQPGDWTAALELALARLPEAHRSARVQHCLGLLETGVLDPRGIFVAREDHDIAGVQVCVPLAGASCLFWLPATADECADQLVQAGLDWRVRFAASWRKRWHIPMKRPSPSRSNAAVLRGHSAPSTRTQSRRPARRPTTLRFETYCPSLHADFSVTLERTYEGTLDCPELNADAPPMRSSLVTAARDFSSRLLVASL